MDELNNEKKELLKIWKSVAKKHANAIHFNLTTEQLDTIVNGVNEFIDSPSEDGFRNFWDKLYAAVREGSADKVITKWKNKGKTIIELSELIEKIKESEKYDSSWNTELGAVNTLGELYGFLHIQDHPIINSCDRYGLGFFGYRKTLPYLREEEEFNEFKKLYRQEVDHVTKGTDHEVPINLEIDQLFNVIHKIESGDLSKEEKDEIKDFYKMVLNIKDGETVTDERKPNIWQISPGHVRYNLWGIFSDNNVIAIGWEIGDISQMTKVEIARALNQKPVDNNVYSVYCFGHKIKGGDIVIAKKGQSKEVYGIGVVTRPYYFDESKAIELFDEEFADYNKFIDVNWVLDFVKELGDRLIISDLKRQFTQWTVNDYHYYTELKRKILDKYPQFESSFQRIEELNKSLSSKESIPEDISDETSYFWITANPKRWRVEEIKQGGEVFYTAYNTKGNKRRIFSSFLKAKPGDKVIFYEATPVKEVIAEGEIAKGLHKERAEGHERPVDGISIKYTSKINPIPWRNLLIPELENSSPIKNGAQGSLFELTKDEFETILSLEEYSEPEIIDETLKRDVELSLLEIKFEDAEGRALVFDDDGEILRKQILSALNSGKNIMLIGPPGTGKTEIARRLCENLLANNEFKEKTGYSDYVLTTATSDWTTFDTIGGYMPKTGEEEGLEFKAGQFLKCFKKEKEDKPDNKWLIIDEINRADIDKAFGQLFTVLSGQEVEIPFRDINDEFIKIRKVRDDDVHIKSNEYVIPKSWRLIATMNTYDKTSLYEMSYAFMRRFAYIHIGVPSDESAIDGLWSKYLDSWNLEDGKSSEAIKEVWKTVNKQQRKIGPAIVKDMLEYTSKGSSVCDAIIAFVLPQLEGVKKEDLEKTLLDLMEVLGDDEKKRMRVFSSEMFPHISFESEQSEG